MLNQQQKIRALRYAFGVTLAVALSSGIEWQLSFLLPILTALMLALPMPRPTLQQGIVLMRSSLIAFCIGFTFTQFILPFTVIYIPLLGLALFYTYYHLNRGGSFWLVLMLLICLLLMPMLAGIHEGLAIGVVSGLVISSWLTIAIMWIAHYFVPDKETTNISSRPGFQPGYSSRAASAALKSTAVAFPIAILFIANNWTSQVLVMIFAAIFTLSPNLNKGLEAGLNSIKSTLIGGCVAFFFYWALVAVPEYIFLVPLMFFVSLGFGVAINSGKPISAYLPSAMVAMIILVNSSLAEGADFSEKFVIRVVLIALSAVYVVLALKVLDAFWPSREAVRAEA